MESIAITNSLPVDGPFYKFNREERNAVAILLVLLTRPGNLEAFARLADWGPPDLAEAEVSVEWTFLRDLWNAYSRAGDGDRRRSAILDFLRPDDRSWLEGCSIGEFNQHFGAVPFSPAYIQSPGRWSLALFDQKIASNDAFLRTCKFKWAFNVKPDLVIQTPSRHVLCVEAKWDSPEGSYPSLEKETAIFRRRGVFPDVKQTDLQRHLVNDVLGFTGSFAYLARTKFVTAAESALTWGEVFSALDRSDSPRFVADWCQSEIDGIAAQT